MKERKKRERWFLEERVNERERVPPSCVDKKEMRRKKEEKSFFGRKGEREGKGKKEKREKRIFGRKSEREAFCLVREWKRDRRVEKFFGRKRRAQRGWDSWKE